MQVSTDLLILNDADMQSRAKIHHVAVLTRKYVKSHVPGFFREVVSHPRHQVQK